MMKYLKLISILFICTLGCLFTACEETTELDEYANWEERNIAFIDSIAKVAEANVDGKWMKILTFDLNPADKNGNPVTYGNENYIYCHVQQAGSGTVSPLYTDLVSVNYRGRLIPTYSYSKGRIFDESYKGELNSALNTPRNFKVNELIAGWSTALMRMVEGDYWRVYIPYTLGYGVKDKGDIPAYSTLVFDMSLEDIL